MPNVDDVDLGNSDEDDEEEDELDDEGFDDVKDDNDDDDNDDDDEFPAMGVVNCRMFGATVQTEQ